MTGINIDKTIRTALLLLLSTALLNAQALLDMDPFPKGHALSGARNVYARDAEALRYNPAASFFGYKNDIVLNYLSWIDDSSLSSASYALKPHPDWGFSALFMFFTSGEIQRNSFSSDAGLVQDDEGYWVLDPNDSYRFNQFLLGLNASYLLKLGNFFMPVGVNLKGSVSLFDGDNLIYGGADVGVLLPVHINSFLPLDTYYIRKAKSAERNYEGAEKGEKEQAAKLLEKAKRMRRRRMLSLLLIPEQISIQAANIGSEFDPKGGLTKDPVDPRFTLGVGYHPVNYLDLYNLRFEVNYNFEVIRGFKNLGLNLGIVNSFNFNNTVELQLLSGVELQSAGVILPAAGLFVGLEIKDMRYSLSYSIRKESGLGFSHQFAANAAFGVKNAGASKKSEKLKFDELNRAIKLIKGEKAEYKEAALILQQLKEEYPDDEQIEKMYNKIIELEKTQGATSDFFYY